MGTRCEGLRDSLSPIAYYEEYSHFRLDCLKIDDNKELSMSANEDLAKERARCDFNVSEITNILDGGIERTKQRKKIESIALSNGKCCDVTPEETLGPKERYENAIRKSCLYTKIVKDQVLTLTGLEVLGSNSSVLRRTADAFFKDISPFLLHLGMFVPTIMGQGTPEQQSYWLPRALDFQIIGTYAQTELGHGTFIRGLETTATYDPDTEEFVIHSPRLTSYKWWAGGLGKTSNYCIVVAQLYTQGKCYGIHPFIVQIRDEDTHMPLPGVRVGEIGPRMGFNTADNGFLGFDHYRIPRNHMLMKNSQVLKDGTYVKVASHSKLTYGTMVFVRVMLVNEVAFNLAKAATIAVRYSAVRRQSEKISGEPEPQIIDYVTQQHKLFVCIATAHALQLSSNWLWKTFSAVLADMRGGNTENLPELHALSSCLKALSTSDSAALIEQCRLACGGHGYMLSSNLPLLYSFVTATRTYEGDYTVLLLQTARFLIKAWEQAESGNPVTPTVSYMEEAVVGNKYKWNGSAEGIIKAAYYVAAGKISSSVTSIRKRMKNGKAFEDAWELTGVQLVAAAEAHCRAVICDVYRKETVRLTANSSPNVKTVMDQLNMLYLSHWALERTGDLLRYTSTTEDDLISCQQRYEELLAAIRPNAVGLVDAFDFPDEILQSTLGAYDGRVYERLMEEALKSPLNAEPVNRSFHQYLKPLMQGKL
ncbi:probable peroxisomal acyl-coenzyme A oxidase 1 isoform X3 [Bombyx mandarina]|uniref:Acyl-coenzyme A oxidase n=1 Tax=Bombyx mandarina TaxID=7092 RepID=A0A6J2JPS0_BOMMA|nr:probable peroxisomal acyl-coenzyme A oxidase 1 isoform X3 [Bombyx mandarina]